MRWITETHCPPYPLQRFYCFLTLLVLRPHVCIRSKVEICLLSSYLFWTSDYTFRLIRGRASRGYKGVCFSTSLLRCMPSFLLARRIQPSLPLVDREVYRILCTHDTNFHLFGMMWRKKIPVRATAPRFELTSQLHKVSRLPSGPPGQPASYIIVKSFSYQSTRVLILYCCARAQHWNGVTLKEDDMICK